MRIFRSGKQRIGSGGEGDRSQLGCPGALGGDASAGEQSGAPVTVSQSVSRCCWMRRRTKTLSGMSCHTARHARPMNKSVYFDMAAYPLEKQGGKNRSKKNQNPQSLIKRSLKNKSVSFLPFRSVRRSWMSLHAVFADAQRMLGCAGGSS